MPHIRRSRFGRGIDPRLSNTRAGEYVELDPTRGFHGGAHYRDLEPGFAADCANFIAFRGGIEPRSGVSRTFQDAAGTVGSLNWGNDAVLGGGEVFDSEGIPFAFVASRRRIALADSDTGIWEILSPGPFSNQPSGLSNDYWEWGLTYDDGAQENVVIAANSRSQFPKYFHVDKATTTFSNYTHLADAGYEGAKAVVVADSRVVFANLQDTAGNQEPTTFLWSVRGKPFNLTFADGAGAEQRPEMRGEVLAMRPSEDGGFFVFTSEEIWRAIPRRDAYAFEFFPITKELSCPYPPSIVETGIGTMFLGKDYDVYLLKGRTVQSVAQRQQEDSRVQGYFVDNLQEPKRAFALYDERKKHYELFYGVGSEHTNDSFPTRSMTLNIGTGEIFLHRYTQEYSYGFDYIQSGVVDPDATWDNASGTWDSQTSTWDQYGVLISKDVNARIPALFSSKGSSYQRFDGATADDSGAITCFWRSGGIEHPDPESEPWRRQRVWGIWAEYEATVASTASFAWTEDGGSSYREVRQFDVPASNYSASYIPLRFSGRQPQLEARCIGTGPRFVRFNVELKQDSHRGGGSG